MNAGKVTIAVATTKTHNLPPEQRASMEFEQFTPRDRTGNAEPIVSLRKSGSFGLNQAVIDEFFEDAESVALYYEDEENIVGFEPRENNDDDAYVLTEGESGGSITAMAFVNRYQLEPEVTTRYVPEEHDGMVVINVDEPAGTYGDPVEEDDE